ncbi:hypothetical protein ASD45_00250 [Pseudolabrys sp. Root1462]|uniref:nitrous oxide reductase accessory protein NosL n=1 Tax=Pseudolabrys sp. Root1462 TaxID=1736466 RepID=UPI000702F260|nr:nitrous oxide reductase accessory protein NosL [Pseudolabrys sp. Root1462]KQY99401.1 hypothetical protein ASD45_00250 [Pseudolabrys sp. Root1462]
MRRAVVGILLILLGGGLAGCDRGSADLPHPMEPTAESTSHFCGMLLAEHAGPKGQIFLKGRAQPIWFSSVSETVAFTFLPEEPAGVAAIYVNDMGHVENWDRPKPGTWVEARRAWFVLGSDKRGVIGMGDIRREPIPFAEQAAAQSYQADHGGRILRFSEIPQDAILGSGREADSREGVGFAPPAH